VILRALIRLVSAIGLCFVLGFPLWVLLLPQPADPLRATDGIVVTTGGPGRVDRGVELLRAGHAKRLLISGVDRSVRPRELAVTVDAPMQLFECCVDLGREAVDTRSNADETVRWVRKHRYHSIRLVTSAWHMPRARLELSERLPHDVEIVTDPVPGERPPGPMIREYSKYVLRLLSVAVGVN